jgi:hypothetical protein
MEQNNHYKHFDHIAQQTNISSNLYLKIITAIQFVNNIT